MSHDPYQILGVSKDADDAEIKKAYRKLARQLHPDVNPDAASQERFKEVSKAYEILADPEKRRHYDMGGDPFGGGFPGGAGAGFSFTDIMDAFFGGAGGPGQGRGPRSRVRRGQDALIHLAIDLAEAAFGTTREIKVDTAAACPTCEGSGAAPGSQPRTCEICNGRGETHHVQRSFLGEVRTMRPCAACRGFGQVIPEPCRECSGDGRVRTLRTLTVKIPAGVDDGTRVQLAEQGEVGPGGGPAGDLFVELQVRQHELFTRRGRDLLCAVELPMTAAALGATIMLPTLEASLSDSAATESGFTEPPAKELPLEIRAGTQPGAELRLAGQGVPALHGGSRGDIVVRVGVATPTKLDERQEALLQELATLRGEEQPTGHVTSGHKSVFDRLRGAFNPR